MASAGGRAAAVQLDRAASSLLLPCVPFGLKAAALQCQYVLGMLLLHLLHKGLESQKERMFMFSCTVACVCCVGSARRAPGVGRCSSGRS